MHPILARAERLSSYLAAWLVVAVLLAAVLTRQGLTWAEGLALLLPICLVYGFVCLSAWYVCRATPLTTSGVLRVLGSSGFAAVVASGVWVGLERMGTTGLGALPGPGGSTARYEAHEPVLFPPGV